jgi:spore coat protein SA
MKQRVFHLLDEREIFSERDGGAISRWAANALRDGKEIVVCPDFDASWKFSPDRIYKMPGWEDVGKIHPILYRLPWPLQKAWYLRILSRFLTQIQPGDVIYVHNRPACAAALATVAERGRFAVYLHMHNSMLLEANRGQITALQRVPIVYCSRFLQQEAEQAIPQRFETSYVVYNGADERVFQPGESSDGASATVIFTGRLVPYKGVHVLLEAMRLLQKSGAAIRCAVVGGSGFGRSKPTRYVRKLHHMVPENCSMLGYQSGEALAELLQRASIFCCPSIWNDPFPLAPIEAMAAGLPVVASNVGGLPETLAHGGGVLVPPNDPEQLAEALSALAGDRQRRRYLAQAARQAFEQHFRWSDVRAQYLNALQGAQP